MTAKGSKHALRPKRGEIYQSHNAETQLITFKQSRVAQKAIILHYKPYMQVNSKKEIPLLRSSEKQHIIIYWLTSTPEV